jgi:hypothetical protein
VSQLNPYKAALEAMKALSTFETCVQESGLGRSLIDLVTTPPSQINGCAGDRAVHPMTRKACLDDPIDDA